MLIISTKSKKYIKFTLTRNIIYISLIKCKRVTYTMLALELHAIVKKVDILIALLSTINIIINKLRVKQLLIIICTDFFLLYKYIIKLSTIKEKCLIINIILIC